MVSVAAESGELVLELEVAGRTGWGTLAEEGEGLAIGDPNLSGGNRWSGVPYHISADQIKANLTDRFIPESRSRRVCRSRRSSGRRNLRRWSRRSDDSKCRWIGSR
jgi:hypothetical protein